MMMNPLETTGKCPAAPIDIRLYLRQHTHADHVRLDHHPLLSGITKPGYSLATYGLLLAAYFHFYRAIEAGIEDFLGTHDLGFDYAPRRKLPWITADLQQLGVDPLAPGYRPRQPLEAFPIRNRGQLLGTLYTIEGSTLGGQVISRHMATNLALTASHGARFFNAYGEQTPVYWNEFQTFAAGIGTDNEVREQAGLAAQATFTGLETLLDEYHSKPHVRT